jgi:hypothetical protein
MVRVPRSADSAKQGRPHDRVPGAVRISGPEIAHRAHEVPREAPVAVHYGVRCRAAIAPSPLDRAGVRPVLHVIWPYSDWGRLDLATTIPG